MFFSNKKELSLVYVNLSMCVTYTNILKCICEMCAHVELCQWCVLVCDSNQIELICAETIYWAMIMHAIEIHIEI